MNPKSGFIYKPQKCVVFFFNMLVLLLANSEPSAVDAGNILFTYAPNAKSHLHSLAPLIKRFAGAGHNITVVYIADTDPSSESAIFGSGGATIETGANKSVQQQPAAVSVIHMAIPSVEHMLKELSNQIWKGSMYAWTFPFVYLVMTPRSVEAVNLNSNQGSMLAWTFPFFYLNMAPGSVDAVNLNSEQIRQVLNSKWDLHVTSALFCPHGAAISNILLRENGVPYITVSTAMIFPSDVNSMALGHSPVIHPFPFDTEPKNSEDLFKPSKFFHRLNNALQMAASLVGHPVVEWAIRPGIKIIDGQSTEFTFGKFFEHGSAVFNDQMDLLVYPQPTASNIVNYGPACTMKRKPLPEEYLRFLDDPTSKGTVYAAFGTSVRWDGAPEKLDIFLNGLEKIADEGYRVIFSLKTEMPNGRKPPSPDRILIVPWAPQIDILSHPSTKVFISHSGLKSMKESICSRTPILTMPVFAEQPHNSRMALGMGIGRVLNKFTFTADQVYTEVKAIINDDSYASRVSKIRDVYLDRPLSSLDAAEFIASRLIRNEPRKRELRRTLEIRRGSQLSHFESLFFDVLGLIAILTMVLGRK